MRKNIQNNQHFILDRVEPVRIMEENIHHQEGLIVVEILIAFLRARALKSIEKISPMILELVLLWFQEKLLVKEISGVAMASDQ